MSNAGVEGLIINTHQAQEFKEQCEEIHASYSLKTSIYGNPMIINMPFICEERSFAWKIQAYPNNIGLLYDDLGQEQHLVLVITVRKLQTKSKTAGGFCVIGGIGNFVGMGGDKEGNNEEM
jgi:hypothetical protein